MGGSVASLSRSQGLTSAPDGLSHWKFHLKGHLGSKHPKDWASDDFRGLSESLNIKVQAEVISWKMTQNIWATGHKIARDVCNQSMPTFVAAKMIPVPMYQGRSAARAGPRYTSTLMSSYS